MLQHPDRVSLIPMCINHQTCVYHIALYRIVSHRIVSLVSCPVASSNTMTLNHGIYISYHSVSYTPHHLVCHVQYRATSGPSLRKTPARLLLRGLDGGVIPVLRAGVRRPARSLLRTHPSGTPYPNLAPSLLRAFCCRQSVEDSRCKAGQSRPIKVR